MNSDTKTRKNLWKLAKTHKSSQKVAKTPENSLEVTSTSTKNEKKAQSHAQTPQTLGKTRNKSNKLGKTRSNTPKTHRKLAQNSPKLVNTRENSRKLAKTRKNSQKLAKTRENSRKLAKTRENSRKLAKTRKNSRKTRKNSRKLVKTDTVPSCSMESSCDGNRPSITCMRHLTALLHLDFILRTIRSVPWKHANKLSQPSRTFSAAKGAEIPTGRPLFNFISEINAATITLRSNIIWFDTNLRFFSSTYLFSFHFRNQRACHRCTTQRRPLQAPLPGPRSVSDAAPGGAWFANFRQFIFQNVDKIWRFFLIKNAFFKAEI